MPNLQFCRSLITVTRVLQQPSDMDDLNPCELAVGLEWQLQVAVDEQLVEALYVAGVGYIVHLKLDGCSAAASGWRIDVAKYSPRAKYDCARSVELHNGDFLADPPEHLHSDTAVGLRVCP